MKNKMMVYLGVLTMISAFFVAPISALADVLTEAPPTEQKELPQPEQPILVPDLSVDSTEEVVKTEESELSVLEEENLKSSDSVVNEKQDIPQVEEKITDESSYANLTLELTPPREGNKYFTGERIRFYQTIESSSEQLNKEVYSLIEIAKEFVDKDTIQVHADNSIKSYQILDEKTDTWTIKIEYKAITSGGIVSVPISFNQRNYTTAPNSETIVSSGLYFEDKAIASDTLSVYADIVKPTLKKEVSFSQITNGKVTIGLASKEDNSISSSDKAELETIFYVLTATVGTSDGKGIFIDNAKIIEDYLPVEAKFDKESYYSENWDYDEVMNKVTYVVPDGEKPRTGTISKILPVYFPSTKEKESILNNANLKSKSGNIIAQASTAFIPILESRNPYLVGGAYKYVNDQKFDRYIGEKPDDITWTIYPYISENPFNKEAYVKEIEDIVDDNQEYSRVKVSIPKDVIYDHMNLYGAKEDGNYQLIQEKIPTEQDITINKEYRKIKIRFNKPVIYNKEIKLNPVTKVKESIWAAGMDGKRVLNTVNVTYSDPEGNVLGSSTANDTTIYKAPRIGFRTTIEDVKQVEGHINDIKNIKYYLDFPNVAEGEEAYVVTLLPGGVVPIGDNEHITVINNYLNTGKVAILQKVAYKKNQNKPLQVSVKLAGSLGKGEHKLQHYVYWKNKAILPSIMTAWEKPPYIIKNNPLDFDKLGTYVGRDILGDDDLINYYPPLEVMVLKKIGTSPQFLSEIPIEVGETDDIYYEINLENRTNRTIENYNFYDILPFPGDKVSNQKNQGSNNSRGSTNSVVFSEIISKDDDLEIYYSSDNNIENLKLTTWHKLESDTPVNQIKSLKGVPKTKLEPNQKMSVVFKVKANEMKGSSVTKNAALLSQENQNILVDSNTVEARSIKPATTEVKGTKTWEDNENKDGNRPESITVNLLADGKQVDTQEVTEATGWGFEFKDLAKFKNNQEINYTVEEVKVLNYEVSMDETNKETIKLVNTYKPETTEVKGTKMWEDNENKDGNRPVSITVNLLADGKQVDTQEVTEATGWDFEFTELAKFKNTKEIIYSVTENSVEDYTTEIKGFDIINHYTPGKTSVTVTKQWDDNNNQDGIRSKDIKLQLLANGKKQGEVVTLTATGKWSYTWSELNQKANGKDITYTIEEISIPGYEVAVDSADKGNIILINKHTPELTSVEGSKTWQDNDNQDGIRPEKITVNLLGNGQKITEKEVSESDNWAYRFTNLPKYQNGNQVVYTVTENEIPEYQTEISGFNITNTYTPGKTSVTVTKDWQDDHNRDGKRPNMIQVQLLANGKEEGQLVTLSASNNWHYTWKELAEKGKGKPILYTIKEMKVPGYKAVVDNTDMRNIKLTNHYTPEKISVRGTKNWEDKNNQDGIRPEKIKVNLLADGHEIDNKEITELDNWKYEFSDLPKYQNGQEIVYTVTENQVPDYQTTISGFDITNTYTPGKTSLTMTKEWLDDNNQDGIRPKSINVQLLGNGKKQGEVVTITEADQWSYTWTGLDQKANGQDIFYTIEEVDVLGYTSTVDTTDKGNVKLVNIHLSEKIAVKGTKTWKDNNNEARKRPEQITINLLADGKFLAEKEVTKTTDWRYEFIDLPKYQNGQEILYTVTENQVPEYQTTISGFDITNTYAPKKTSMTVTKEWTDNNDQDKIRPSSIKVQLLANGKKHGEAVVITKNDKWSYTWSDLMFLDDKNKPIYYTIEEVDVANGYTASYRDSTLGNMIITNIHTPVKPKIPSKVVPPKTNKTGGKLPKTGEATVNWLPIVGLVLIFLSSRIIYVKKNG